MKTALYLATLLFLTPLAASAATLSADPASAHVRPGAVVSYTLYMSADESINTVGTAVIIPQGLSFVSASEGPAITQWVEVPAYDAKSREVEFSGIIPGGWKGANAKLATITLRAKEEGDYSLAFDPAQTELYKNDGKATPDVATFGIFRKSTTDIGPTLLALLVIGVILLFLLVRRKVAVQFV